MLVKAALVVLILASLLTAGMDDQQTAAVPAAPSQENIHENSMEDNAIKTASAKETVSGWADEITPITFVLYR